jgi:hypothetical protein
MALTDTAIRNAKPKDKPFKLGDSGGLFFWCSLLAANYGREKKLAIGTHPEVSLADARKRRDGARELVASGKDPSREKQQPKHRALIAAGDKYPIDKRPAMC